MLRWNKYLLQQPSLCEKCPNTEFFLVRIFPYSDRIRSPVYLSPNPVRIRENMEHFSYIAQSCLANCLFPLPNDILSFLLCWSYNWVKNVRIRSYSGPYFPAFWLNTVFSRIRTEYREIRCISPYSNQMRENTDQSNSEYGQFLLKFKFCLSSSICWKTFVIFAHDKLQLLFLKKKISRDLFFLCINYQTDKKKVPMKLEKKREREKT